MIKKLAITLLAALLLLTACDEVLTMTLEAKLGGNSGNTQNIKIIVIVEDDDEEATDLETIELVAEAPTDSLDSAALI